MSVGVTRLGFPVGSGVVDTAVTVTDAPTPLPATGAKDRQALLIQNNSDSIYIYIGGSKVTTASGFKLHPNGSLPLNCHDGSVIYAICPIGQTADVRCLESII